MVVERQSWTSIACASILGVLLVRFLFKLYWARRTIAKLRKHGLPMPPWNPILGHLYFMYKITSKLPKDAGPNYPPDIIRRELPDLGPIYYLDTWPVGPQMLIVASTGGLHQVVQEQSLPKYHALKDFLRPISDGFDIVTMEGDLWKTWRGIFNPGFSSSSLVNLTGSVVGETSRFCNILQERMRDQKLFKMKELTDYLTMDIIGRVVLDVQLNSQEQSNPLVDGLRMQIRWLTFGADANHITRYNPIRPLVQWFNSRRMNRFLSKEIDSRVAKLENEKELTARRNKPIIDVLLTTSMSAKAMGKTNVMDGPLKKFIMGQMKLFLFSGHDTTSSTACWIFYILATNPAVLSRVRAEHASILGTDPSKFASLVTSDPYLLNQLPYTLATIKEILRMYPAASSTRAGKPDYHITDDLGNRFPTDGFLVWANPQVVHRDPKYWPRPDDFLPERWLVAPGDPLHPVKGAWRPFEHGPRNCIASELAILEMKVIMVMTASRFDVRLAYQEIDRARGAKGITNVYGERAYQIQRSQPSEDLPCRVAEIPN